MSVNKVIIIGSGPAGYTAAMYAARAELAPLLFEGRSIGGAPGGQLMLTTEVENYPGFPNGLQGPELMAQFRKQAERFGTRIVSDDIVEVDFSPTIVSPPSVRGDKGGCSILPLSKGEPEGVPFVVKTARETYEAKAVIVCTGAQAIWLGVPGEREYQGRGVSACATCDGFFFKGKNVVVVGGGDSAMEEATFLTKFASKVTVMHRRNELRASKIMQARAMNNSKIEFMWNTQVKEVLGDSVRMTSVKIFNNATNETAEFAADGLFMAIGHTPNTDIFQGQLELDQKGYIVTRPHSTHTSVDGVFAGGDVIDHVYRQAVTAAGTGCMAALDAERWLTSQAN